MLAGYVRRDIGAGYSQIARLYLIQLAYARASSVVLTMELGPVLIVINFLLQAASAQFQYPMTYGQQARSNPLDFIVELSHIPLPVSPFKLDFCCFKPMGSYTLLRLSMTTQQQRLYLMMVGEGLKSRQNKAGPKPSPSCVLRLALESDACQSYHM